MRYYERIGLLPEAERVGGKRRYEPDVLERLAVIATAQRAGLSLDEVRELLEGVDAGEPAGERLQALARRKLPEVEAPWPHTAWWPPSSPMATSGACWPPTEASSWPDRCCGARWWTDSVPTAGTSSAPASAWRAWP